MSILLSILEAVNQTAFQAIGNDLAITIAIEARQLQLKAMEPLIIFQNLLLSLQILKNACNMFTECCIHGIPANVRNSIGIYKGYYQEKVG